MNTNFRSFLILALVALIGISPFVTPREARAAEPYAWRNVAIGGGGYVLDVYCHPKQKDLVYIRTDVGGFFRWDAPQERWISLSDQFGRSQSNYYGGEGLALDPQDPNIVYMAAGKYEWNAPGTIFKSRDQGRTWKKLPMDLKMGGNEDHRSGGPRLVVSPWHSSVLLFGSRQNGLWRSADAGASWAKVNAFPATLKKGLGITALAFAAKTPNVVYAAAFGDAVYQSDDDGLTWRKTPGSPAEVERLAASPDGALYATHAHGVGKYAQGQWADATPPANPGKAFGGVSIDPRDPRDLLVAAQTDHLRLFRSRDGGATWREEKTTTQSSVPWYSESMKKIQYVAGLTFDPWTPGRVWLTDWYATYRTENIEADPVRLTNWEQGHEELVVFTLACPPGGPALLSGTADVDGFSHDRLDTFPAHGLGEWYGGKGPTFGYTEGFVWCPTQPSRVARAGVIPWNHAGGGALSTDGGRTWAAFPVWDSKIMAARIAVSATDPKNMVVLRVGPGPAQITRDGGASWQNVRGLPDELVHDVWNWQTPLAGDGGQAGVFYVFQGGTVYKSVDGGASFAVSASGLPGGAQGLVTVPNSPGEVWIVGGDGGLLHSTDGAQTFHALVGVKQASLLAVGKPAPGSKQDALYLYGALTDTRAGIFRSVDGGTSWDQIDDPRIPIGDDPNSIAASFDTFGQVFIGTNGRGIYYGQPINALKTPSEAAKTTEFPNGDMSLGGTTPTGWALTWTGAGKLEAARDTQTFHSAPAALCLRSMGGAATGAAGHGIDVAQTPFTISGFVKATGKIKASLVAIQVFDGGGKQIGWISLATLNAPTDWQAFSSKVQLPKGAAAAQLALTIDGDGQVWLDDVSLASDAPPSPKIETEATPLPISIAPSNPLARYIGRFDLSDAGGPRCSWPADAVELKFRASALNVKLSDSNNDEYQIRVDGKPTDVLTTKSGTRLYSIFRASAPETHTIALVKRTEALFGTTQFQGFQFSQGGKLLPLPPRLARRIEVIGDSISCGYGDEAQSKDEHFSSATENADLAYGAVAARALGAEYVCTAWSGKTMWPKNTIGELYDRVLPTETTSRWDFSRWTPNVVVINLSTNDFAGGVPDRKNWTDAYEAFIARVRKHYPQAAIYCATSPMLWGSPVATAKAYLTQIVQDENAAGDKNVRLLEFATQDAKNGFGADWHPSLKTQALMADTLVQALQAHTGWQPVGK